MTGARPDWRDELLPFLDVTVDDLREAMRRIPEEILEKLSRGPHPDRYSCNVCRAFTKPWIKGHVRDRQDPMCIVFDYHEVPKIEMHVAEDQWSGPAARDVYRRCQEIYAIAREIYAAAA